MGVVIMRKKLKDGHNILKDERIIKESNKILAPLYVLVLTLTCIVAVTKYLFLTQEISYYILEIIGIITSIGYLFVRSILKGIPIFYSEDECIKELQNTYRAHSFSLCIWIYLFGGFILLFIQGQEVEIVGLYIFIWFIPSAIITIKGIKRGLFVWGSKNREKKGIVSFKKNVLLGSLFFGIIMGWSHLWKDGSFQPMGIVVIIGSAVSWGIPFYFIMKLMMSKSEKNSNKELEKAEKLD